MRAGTLFAASAACCIGAAADCRTIGAANRTRRGRMKRSLPLLLCFIAGCTKPNLEVRLGVASDISAVTVRAADKLGYFAAEHLNVQLVDPGNADVSAGSYAYVLESVACGVPLRAFALLSRSLSLVVITAPANVRKLERINDLDGKRVGVSALGAPDHLLLNYLLVENALAPDDVTPVAIGDGQGAMNAIGQGTVDAAVVGNCALQSIESNYGPVTILADTRTIAGLLDTYGVSRYPAEVLYATPQWLSQHAEEARRLVRAVARAAVWIRTHPAQDPKCSENLAMVPETSVITADGAAAVQKVLSISVEKMRNAKIDLQSTYTNDFVTK